MAQALLLLRIQWTSILDLKITKDHLATSVTSRVGHRITDPRVGNNTTSIEP